MAETTDDTAATEKLLPAADGSVVEESQIVTDPQSMTSDVEDSGADSVIDPETAIFEAAVAEDFNIVEELAREELKAADAAARPISESVQLFAAEAKNYARTYFEGRAAFSAALLGAKTLDAAVQMQTSYAISAYARFLAHLLKVGGLYGTLLGAALKPVEKVTAKADRT